jgi:hypothetical protein
VAADLRLSNCNQFTRLAAASAFLALTAVSAPASPDELAEYLGPVGPHEAILTTVGDQRVIAFYEPGNDHCSVHAVVWANTKTDAVSAARVRIRACTHKTVWQMPQHDSAQHDILLRLRSS